MSNPIDEYKIYFNGLWSEEYFAKIPNYSGIYVIYSGTNCRKVSLKEILYIGQSKFIRNRIAKHEKLSVIRDSLMPGDCLFISTAKVLNKRLLHRIEAKLIFDFAPKHNMQYSDRFEYPETVLIVKDKYGLLSELVNA